MQDIGKKILFYIDKIENNTIYITEILQTTNKTIRKNSEFLSNLADNLDNSNLLASQTTNTEALDYDSSGAAKYIIVVVLLYGFGIIFFIGSQVRSTQKYSDEVDGVNAEKVLKSMDTVIFTKEVLEKLSDKALREKAWKIYLTDSTSPEKKGELGPEVKKLLSTDSTKELGKEIMNSVDRKLKILNAEEKEIVETVKEINSKDIFKNNFQKKNSEEKKTKNKQNNAPKLILQTDAEGLEKLKEMKTKNKNCQFLQDDKDTSYIVESESATFDLLEISEKITSV